MKSKFSSMFTICIFASLVVYAVAQMTPEYMQKKMFASWKQKHGKSYNTNFQESKRFAIWQSTDTLIQSHNKKHDAGLVGFRMVHNEMSDMSKEEIATRLGATLPSSGRNFPLFNIKQAASTTTKKRTTTTKRTTITTTKRTTIKPLTSTTKPTTTTTKPTTTTTKPTTSSTKPTTSTTKPTTAVTKLTTTTARPISVNTTVDWRTVPNMLQPIKDQGSCGSCWAFAAIGALEAAIFKKNGISMSLSEQQLVDCTYTYDGCQGGWMGSAYKYLKGSIGSDKQSAYGYISGSSGMWSTCKTTSLGTSAVGFSPVLGYVQSPSGTESWLQNAVATVGPVTIGFDVVTSFYYYSSGVYYDADCNSASANYQGGHAVVVVGYGTDPTQGDYWIMRNSWGTWWGNQGYFLMARNRGNLCGLATYATYPLI